ncbi:MAG: GAF domain-containing protein [Leptolyngbyaceae cyanobacterium RU_5_1]|nr:GAF domain-containing protein [Leptolyngbyaceae cyanobacterium RU_5_1]
MSFGVNRESGLNQENLLQRITNRIRQSLELDEILATTAAEARSFLGTDRVMIYKFHPDQSGQVVAEAIADNRLPSLLGLNFPADDIPTYAREMFMNARVRIVVDVASMLTGRSSLYATDSVQILSDKVHYHRLDPCHAEYLTAMGVQSSVVVPILTSERLWGLLVSHHTSSRSVPDDELQGLQMVADQLSVAIAQSTLLTQARHQAHQEATINRIAALLHSLSTIELQSALEETVAAFQGAGGRLYIQAAASEFGGSDDHHWATCFATPDCPVWLYTCGIQPVMPKQAKFSLMEQYNVWSAHFNTGNYQPWAIHDLYQIPELRNLQVAFQATQIRGILMMSLQYRQQALGYLTIFRNERDTETLWAGRFDSDQRQLQARLSFQVWRESKKGQAPEWIAEDIELAKTLSQQFASAIQQYEMHRRLQTFNTRLEHEVQERTKKLELATEQQRILFRVVTKIRESLDLDRIFRTTAKQVRRSLNADRVAVFRFDPESNFAHGEVVAEDVLPEFSPILGVKIQDHCYEEQYVTKYRQGRTQAIADIHVAELQDCYVEMLVQLQVIANLVVPLKQGDDLWGLLCVHQCAYQRDWETSEVQFATQVATQLGVALQQAELLWQTKQQADQLAKAFHNLQQTQTQLIQTEKMSSLGQLVAGVAHEINNPVNFIYGNLTHMSRYADDLLSLLGLYQQHFPNPPVEICDRAKEIDLEFLTEDLQRTLSSMRIGTDRIRQIVLSLRNFSRIDQIEMKPVDIHEGIDSTLLILQHRFKGKGDHPKIQLVKEYGELPLVECYAGQLNQVFMNVLSNAIDALEERMAGRDAINRRDAINGVSTPTIRIQTETIDDNRVRIRISDNGPGIQDMLRARVFDPFFTTKPVGKGTGLGLSISYQIVVEKHSGVFTCNSQAGQGTEFWIEIPVSTEQQARSNRFG